MKDIFIQKKLYACINEKYQIFKTDFIKIERSWRVNGFVKTSARFYLLFTKINLKTSQ